MLTPSADREFTVCYIGQNPLGIPKIRKRIPEVAYPQKGG